MWQPTLLERTCVMPAAGDTSLRLSISHCKERESQLICPVWMPAGWQWVFMPLWVLLILGLISPLFKLWLATGWPADIWGLCLSVWSSRNSWCPDTLVGRRIDFRNAWLTVSPLWVEQLSGSPALQSANVIVLPKTYSQLLMLFLHCVILFNKEQTKLQQLIGMD